MQTSGSISHSQGVIKPHLTQVCLTPRPCAFHLKNCPLYSFMNLHIRRECDCSLRNNVEMIFYKSLFFFFGCAMQHAGSPFLNQGSNLHLPWWKQGVFTAGAPGKAPYTCLRCSFLWGFWSWLCCLPHLVWSCFSRMTNGQCTEHLWMIRSWNKSGITSTFYPRFSTPTL